MTGPGPGVPRIVVESDKAFFQLQNDTKIDLLAVFYPEICSREW